MTPKENTLTPERIEILKISIQKYYDNENWYGINTKERILSIAANVELIEHGIVFSPIYNCPA